MEDRYVEWAQFYLLTFTAVLCLKIAGDLWRKENHTNYFYIFSGFFCALVAIEEISWGQRILGYEVPQFFRRYNGQSETEFHNIIGEVIDYTYLLGLIALVWGVILPLLVSSSRKGLAFFERLDHVIPPRVLIIGFLSGSISMSLLAPSKAFWYEPIEEIGELFIYMSLFYFVLIKWNEKKTSSTTSSVPISLMINSTIFLISITVLSTTLTDTRSFNLSGAYYYSYGTNYVWHEFYKEGVEQYEKLLGIKPNSQDFNFLKNLNTADIEIPSIVRNLILILDINGDRRVSLFPHTPSKITYKLALPERAILSFGIGVNPEVWSGDKGDGVLFEIYVEDESVLDRVFSKYIDPRNNVVDRKWHDETVDLSRYNGKHVNLSFVTIPGPLNNGTYDLPVWSDPRLISTNKSFSK